MKLRTKLILSFVLLAVIPLAGITLYSYKSSISAFQVAVEEESRAAAEDMNSRMELMRRDLERRVRRLSAFPFGELMAQERAPHDGRRDLLYEQLLSQMGDSANLVKSLEFMPMPPPPPRIGAGKPGDNAHEPQIPPAPPPVPDGLVIHLPGEHPAAAAGGMGSFVTHTGDRLTMHIDIPNMPELSSELSRQIEAARQETLQGLKAEAAVVARAMRAQAKAEAGVNAGAARQAQASDDNGRSEANGGLKVTANRSEFQSAVRQGGETVGIVKAQVSSPQMLRAVLSRAKRSRNEVPFAIDTEGQLQTPEPADLAKIEALPIKSSLSNQAAVSKARFDNWVVVTRKDPESGLTFGIARPIGDGLEEIRRTAVRNLGLGLGIVGLALLGIIPLSSRITRNLTALTKGVENLAQGNLETRVTVRSKDEFGRLAGAFNQMAHDLAENQKHLVEQERLRKELEMCRRIQEEMLPKQTLHSGFAEVRGATVPAREVGGDFFNYFQLPGDQLALLVGDVSGKGLPAALLMANVQATLQAKIPLELDLVRLAKEMDSDLCASTPEEVYLTLLIGILDSKTRMLRYVKAGHNPQFVLRRDSQIERLDSTGRPLGLGLGGGFEERRIRVSEGDYLFFYTDGLTEAENPQGEEFGTARLERLLLAECQSGLDVILARVEGATKEHLAGRDAPDDATMMLVSIGA